MSYSFHLEEMREYITASEGMFPRLVEDFVPEVPVVTPSVNTELLHALEDAVVRLRSITESAANADYALGVEMGMQRAAEMIENIVRRHTEDPLDNG